MNKPNGLRGGYLLHSGDSSLRGDVEQSLNPDCPPVTPESRTLLSGLASNRRVRGSTVAHAIAKSTYDYAKADYFVVQIYLEGSRTVFSMWGIERTGTYASGVYFADVIQPNLATYTQSYLICKWTDLNSDGIQQSNEITVLTSGS